VLLKRLLVLIPLLLFCIVGNAQQNELRTLFLAKFDFNSDWRGSLDGGYYRGLNGSGWDRYGIRAIAQRRLNSKVQFDAGFMFNHVNNHDGTHTNEYRPHQTVKLAYPRFSRMTINHRFRLEEQIIYRSSTEKTQMTSRFRYELKTKRAFNLEKFIQPKTFYWIASSEITFNFTGHIKGEYNFFERGRHGLGVGYRVNTNTSVESTAYFQHTHKGIDFHDHSDLFIFNFCIVQSIFVN